MKQILLFTLALQIGILLLSKAIAKSSNKVDIKILEQGKKVFEENCQSCHGVNGDGEGPASVAIKDPKPRDFTTGVFKYGSSDEEIFKTISNGVPGTAMPPWSSLNKNDRKAVILYIRSFKK